MARVKTARTTRARHKKVLKRAKGYYGAKHYRFRNANQAKLANPFTVDDNNNLISILKRDNFLNPDIRYKNGGFLNNYLIYVK